MTIRDITRAATLVLALVAGLARGAASQDLEPRAYSASPVGTTFVVAAVGRSSGNVLTDPSLPVEDVQATLGIATAGAGYTFDLLSRTALVLAAFPYGRAHATGRVQEAAAEVSRVGWADARFKLSVNLIGGKALRRSEFATARRSTIVGVSLTAVAPTGQYFSDKLVNLGSNRWSLKPEAGVSFPLGHFSIDGYAGVWLFGSNDQFYPGTALREQERVIAFQGHASYTFRPRLWAAIDGTWYTGGSTTVNGVAKGDLQRNSRLGATVSVPLGGRQSLKGSFSTGASTRIGADFNTMTVAWQMSWLGR